MRVVYFGSGAFGLPTLQALLARHEVALVVTQPDRPAGRNRQVTTTPIGQAAAGAGVAVYKAESVNDRAMVQHVHAQQAEAFIVIAFGQKLGSLLLGDTFAINLHASLLPKYRGAAPIPWAIINQERQTGVSVITLADRMDAGAILAQASTDIDPMETAGELHDRLASMGPDVVMDVLCRHEAGRLSPVAQDEALATRAPKLSKEHGTVRFDQPAQRVRCWVHGLTPWPGCTVRLNGRPLRITRAGVVNQQPVDAESGIVLPDYSIACDPGAVKLLSVQAPGGKMMSFEAYRHGQAVPVGARCEAL